jgi:crotonobetainyl-CoA:carnitine CoA-transferase CaiB-like acyl-CoA transferase
LTQGALDGVRVLDLTHHIAGPYCTKLLADFGADVVKVERPGGDPARRMPPFFDPPNLSTEGEIPPDPPLLKGGWGDLEKSLLFLYLNTNKRSITLNLKAPLGREMLKELARDADLLVENFSPRVMPSLGFDFETLRELNPALVVGSISNFGQTGPYRDYQATDIVEYALGGLMYVFGSYDREPLIHALHQAQFKAGTNAASAILMALYHRQRTGQGQQVDVSIQECISSALRDVVNNYIYTGAVRRRQPNHSGDLTRLREVSDGYVLPNPGLSSAFDWRAVVEFLGLPELDDERFNTPSARLANADELGQILDRYFLSQKKFDVFYAAQQRRFIYGVVQSPGEVLADEHVRARGYFVPVDHPVLGTVEFPGAPFNMNGTPWKVRRPAPTLGQHNSEVFGERLGYSGVDLARLRATGVV